jgi:hypothetical protein
VVECGATKKAEAEDANMELTTNEWEQSQDYLDGFDVLIGDERTRRTFRGVIEGIIGGESLRASVIARFSPGDGGDEVW